jgi:hypothetical protein
MRRPQRTATPLHEQALIFNEAELGSRVWVDGTVDGAVNFEAATRYAVTSEHDDAAHGRGGAQPIPDGGEHLPGGRELDRMKRTSSSSSTTRPFANRLLFFDVCERHSDVCMRTTQHADFSQKWFEQFSIEITAKKNFESCTKFLSTRHR